MNLIKLLTCLIVLAAVPLLAFNTPATRAAQKGPVRKKDNKDPRYYIFVKGIT